MALVHGAGLRSGDPRPLHLFEEPARAFPAIESVPRVVRTHRGPMHQCRAGERREHVGGWKLDPRECEYRQSSSAGVVGRSREGELRGTKIPGGTRAAERGRRTRAPTREGIDHGTRMPRMRPSMAGQQNWDTSTTI